MRKEYEKPIIEEESIHFEDICASSGLDVNQPTDNLNGKSTRWH